MQVKELPGIKCKKPISGLVTCPGRHRQQTAVAISILCTESTIMPSCWKRNWVNRLLLNY